MLIDDVEGLHGFVDFDEGLTLMNVLTKNAKGKLEYETTYSFERIGDALERLKKGL